MSFRLESQAEPIPGYKLISRLGGGGFGEVWKAEAPGGLLKAIKFVYGDLGETEDVRAEQELKSLSRVKTVRHPYILSLERFDIVNGQLMIVMELADRNLWDRYRECRAQGLPGIPREELLRYLEETAEALDLMNNQYQLQHLDIKPQNVFLVYNHVKVADFGLVKDLEGRGAASVTGGVTPIYAAPEMFDGYVSRYCDQYSLAIVYQELLTGQRPFTGNNVHQLVMQHVQGKPNLAPLPPDERQAIARALSKTPEDRFPSCTDLVHALWFKSGPPVPAPGSSGLIPRVAIQEKLNRQPPSDHGKSAEAPVISPTPATRFGVAEELATHMLGTRVEEPPKPEAPRKVAPPAVTGEGELFPALVIGLGQMGLQVLRHLHRLLQENFGSREVLGHLRLLYLDTDPEALQTLGQPNQELSLLGREVLLARLNRASHYLKLREGRPRLETWFNTNMLYRIQRSQVTGGVRALGRLAFIDNYRMIAQRLRADLDACTDPAALESASQHTGLKVRSNRPRVYVVNGLAGGTGSGMFIDLAYVVRSLLHQMGYDSPDVTGLFLLPAVNDAPAHKMALGNTLAALTELNHFSSPDVVFSARYDDREGTIQSREAPFSRCFFLPLPEGTGESPARQEYRLLSEFLYRDLTTPLGRAADTLRAAVPPPSRALPGLVCQTFGLFRFSWPRRVVLNLSARRLCRQLVERWLVQDDQAVRDTLARWVPEKWTAKELAPDFMMARLQSACERELGRSPEIAFTELTKPLTLRGWWNPQVDAEAVLEAVNTLDQWLGQPSASAVLNRTGLLEERLRQEADRVHTDWKENLTRLTLPLVEQPDLRLAGAEEAIRRFLQLIDHALEQQQPLFQEINGQAAQAQERLQVVRPNLREIVTGGRRTAAMVNELLELLRQYPKRRYQALVLRYVNQTLASLRGFLSDQLREVATCRLRLGELLQHFQDRDPDRPSDKSMGPRRFLYPAGCRSLEDAVERLVASVKPPDLDELDRRIQTMIHQQFRTLVHACTTSSHLLNNLESSMLEEAGVFAGTKLADDDVVEMFLGRHPSKMEVLEDLAGAFHEAAPRISGHASNVPTEVCILAVPSTPREGELRELARRAVPEADLSPAAGADDIVFYREETLVVLSDLDQAGSMGQEAYQQMAATENFTPHSRADVTEWTPLVSGQ